MKKTMLFQKKKYMILRHKDYFVYKDMRNRDIIINSIDKK